MADHLTLDDLARACRTERGAIVEWVELGVVHVAGAEPERWRFDAAEAHLLGEVARLARELDLPPHAAALVHDLLAHRGRLERRVRLLERLLEDR
jgi:hypothetical protein